MFWHCEHAYYAYLAAEYEAGRDRVERHAPSEQPIPLRWVAAWIGGLAAISLGLGSLSQWLLH